MNSGNTCTRCGWVVKDKSCGYLWKWEKDERICDECLKAELAALSVPELAALLGAEQVKMEVA